MKIICSLIFGHPTGVNGRLIVSPSDMLTFYKFPFKLWLKEETWDRHPMHFDRSEFNETIYNALEGLDEGNDLHPSEFDWHGLRFDIEDAEGAAEIIFCKDRVAGAIHLNYHKICGEMYSGVAAARRILNAFQTPFKGDTPHDR